MTTLEINMLIAEEIGDNYHAPTVEEIKSGSYYQYEPDFHRSLDQCHRMERSIIDDDPVWSAYMDELDSMSCKCMVHATAPMKCEAFLKAVGKWREENKV